MRLREISELKLSNINLDDKSILIKDKGSRKLVSKGRILFLDNPDTFYSLSRYLKIRDNI